MYNIIIKILEVFTLNRMSEQFEKLNGRFGGNAVLKCVELDFKSKKFFNSFKNSEAKATYKIDKVVLKSKIRN